jgi:hypothetical protein
MGEKLPPHDHTTNLLKTKAKQEEKNIIKTHATLPKTRNKATVNEVAQNILSSSYPNTLYSMSISGAIKMAVYREKTAYYKYRYSFLPNQHYGWLHVYDSQFMDQQYGAGGHDGLHF